MSISTAKGPSEIWNGEFYVSYGHRSWDDARQFGFIAGGGKPWYSRTLGMLNTGDRVWVNVPGSGYVGVGEVMGRMLPAREFTVNTPQGPKPVLEVVTRSGFNREKADDLERCDYFVPIRWLHTVARQDAVHEAGFFGNRNTVCKPRAAKWRTTLERLRQVFGIKDPA